ncbi:iron-sulfur cluster assembly scaffold protein [bacterium (Candidatus Gribaldobacteria) CG_4_9_14_3_um_filter_33_9]|nr:MAG: iron-sulfur cluster assembly scaffold protein [bacterium (Candidatus Gribaldobacteria) CG_4_9_14_3_um_filter_33_9]
MKQYYSKEVIKRFLHPKNLGKIKNPDGVGDTENLRCGDIMKIYIKIIRKKGKEYIKDARFQTLGCSAAIATSDIICDLVKGKTIEKAKRIGFKDVRDRLQPLPPQKLHCCLLAERGLKQAIADYQRKKHKKCNDK